MVVVEKVRVVGREEGEVGRRGKRKMMDVCMLSGSGCSVKEGYDLRSQGEIHYWGLWKDPAQWQGTRGTATTHSWGHS